MVFALCNVLLRDRQEAEDATQQCFLSAQKSMLAGTAPLDPPAWLAAIARNECLSRLRRRRPDTVELRDDDQPAASDVAELVDRRAEITALSEAIAGLPPAQRQAVILRDFYGLSYREVSLALGVSGPAVESLLFKSRRRLQERLAPLHVASGAAAVPAVVREALVRAIPGFSSGLPATGIGAAGTGLSAKLLSGPAAAKLAALALAAGAGTVALAHEPAKLFPGHPTPRALAADRPVVRARAAPPTVTAIPVVRPPDAVAGALAAKSAPIRAPTVAGPKTVRAAATGTSVTEAPQKVATAEAVEVPPPSTGDSATPAQAAAVPAGTARAGRAVTPVAPAEVPPIPETETPTVPTPPPSTPPSSTAGEGSATPGHDGTDDRSGHDGTVASGDGTGTRGDGTGTHGDGTGTHGDGTGTRGDGTGTRGDGTSARAAMGRPEPPRAPATTRVGPLARQDWTAAA